MVKSLSRQIKKIEAKENKGSYGSWRKDFCKKYLGLLIRIRKNTYTSLIETLTSQGEKITCREGCTYCCFEHMTVSAAHGIVIVDYLYQRKKWLNQFVQNYDTWRHKGYRISDSIDHARIQASASSMPVSRVMEAIGPLSARYVDMNIQCPFLTNNRCFIYKVRPLPCSGHYSVSPADWCDPITPQKPTIHQLIPKEEDLAAILQIADPRLMLYELTLPIMIHKLLTEGSSFIVT